MELIKSLKKIASNKYYLIADVLIMLYISTSQSLFSQQNYEIRILFYIIFFVYILLVIKIAGIEKEKMGFNLVGLSKVFKQSILPIGIFVGSLTIGRLVLPSVFNLGVAYNSIIPVITRGLAYVIISVPVQEIIFRSYVIYRFEQFTQNRYALILISSLLFSAVHWPFNSLILSLGSFLLGLYLADNFLRFRNIYVPMIIHGILGILLMIFSIKVD